MIDFLMEHAAKDPVSFHMPGHKGAAIFRKYGFGDLLGMIADIDVTEIPGADNLFQGEGIIRELQERYAGLYGVRQSYLLINGSSGGIVAAILAAVRAGRKIIMARNSHKSIFNAIALGNIEPVYAYPKLDEGHYITGPVEADEIARLIAENPDADAVVLPSPNYYGICSDIAAIAKVVHDAGKVLIVDQAHGAHLKFFHKFGQGRNMPQAAEDCGADIVINSIHKTLASLTQSALLNLNSDRVDRYVLEDKLQAVESTSPSYILMSFLDINARILEAHGGEAMRDWRDNVDYFYERAKDIRGLKVMDPDTALMDRTKINIGFGEIGISGEQLEQLLMEYAIFPELYTGDLLMLMTGIGNTREHMERTLAALEDIAKRACEAGGADAAMAVGAIAAEGATDGTKAAGGKVKPEIAMPAQGSGKLHAVPKQKEFVDIDAAAGRICAGSVIPYPPGIPFVCPGEEITPEAVGYIKALRHAGEKVIGVNDKTQVLVGC